MILMIVSYNTLPFLKMAVRSAQRHIQVDLDLWIWDNGSTDGSAEWAERNANRFFTGENRVDGHGAALNQMVDDLHNAKPYEPVITMDSDVEIVKPIWPVSVAMECPDMVHGCAYADFHPLPEIDKDGRRMAPRVNPALALFSTARHASYDFIPCERDGRFYDVGALHKERLGKFAVPSGILKKSAFHYGNSTWPQNGCVDKGVCDRVRQNEWMVRQRFESLNYAP